jgi:circadian clock protein KaiB
MPAKVKKSRTSRTADYILKLYITGATRRSQTAVTNLRSICSKYLEGRYDLEVVDIYQSPGRTQKDNIVAAPTLVRQLPLPARRLVGDLSKQGQVLLLLGLKPRRQTDE